MLAGLLSGGNVKQEDPGPWRRASRVSRRPGK